MRIEVKQIHGQTVNVTICAPAEVQAESPFWDEKHIEHIDEEGARVAKLMDPLVWRGSRERLSRISEPQPHWCWQEIQEALDDGIV